MSEVPPQVCLGPPQTAFDVYTIAETTACIKEDPRDSEKCQARLTRALDSVASIAARGEWSYSLHPLRPHPIAELETELVIRRARTPLPEDAALLEWARAMDASAGPLVHVKAKYLIAIHEATTEDDYYPWFVETARDAYFRGLSEACDEDLRDLALSMGVWLWQGPHPFPSTLLWSLVEGIRNDGTNREFVYSVGGKEPMTPPTDAVSALRRRLTPTTPRPHVTRRAHTGRKSVTWDLPEDA